MVILIQIVYDTIPYMYGKYQNMFERTSHEILEFFFKNIIELYGDGYLHI